MFMKIILWKPRDLPPDPDLLVLFVTNFYVMEVLYPAISVFIKRVQITNVKQLIIQIINDLRERIEGWDKEPGVGGIPLNNWIEE